MPALAAAVETAPVVRKLGGADYAQILSAMRQFTAQRSEDTPDELWLL